MAFGCLIIDTDYSEGSKNYT